ncbi:MAG: DOMON domain-containing protein [Armatimonadota bacterium]
MRSIIISALIYGLLFLLPAAIPAAQETVPGRRSAGNVIMHCSWSTEALYLAFRVDDPLIVGNQTFPMSQPVFDDAIAVYLDLQPAAGSVLTTHCLRVAISAAGGATVQRGDRGEWRNDPSWFTPSRYGTIRYSVKVQGKINDTKDPDGGYQVELALPWGLLDVNPPISRDPEGALPMIGLALACYSQGETQAISCWPPQISELDLDTPARWGRLQFLQTLRPVETLDTLGSAPLVRVPPAIDGDINGLEWVMAGLIKFAKRWGDSVVSEDPHRQAVSLLAGWYMTGLPEGAHAHQPLDPLGPWIGADSPIYHLVQLGDARRAGIDVLAVVIPAARGQRDQARERLLALANALADFDRATTATSFFYAPLVMPVIDFSRCGPAELADETLLQALERIIDDFYSIFAPQFRLMVPDSARKLCAPVLLTDPPPGVVTEAGTLNTVSARVRARWEVPIGWMLDASWGKDQAVPDMLTRCSWNPATGMQLGGGPMNTVMILPGVCVSQKQYLPRRDGELFDNGWVKISSVRPDFVLLRSWNDFAEGTEVTASRQYGYQFIDSTKLASLRLAQSRGFGVRILQHNLPPTLRGGRTYPIELLLKNGSVEKLITREGYHVDYQVLQDGRKLYSGVATQRLTLLEMSTARIRFNLPTVLPSGFGLPAGHYQLQLEFRRNRVPFITAPIATETVGRLTVPFTMGDVRAPAQVLSWTFPQYVAAGASAPMTVTLRNTGGAGWRKKAPLLRLSWVSETGETLPGEVTLAITQRCEPGGTVQVGGPLPLAPGKSGWYRVQMSAQLAGASVPLQAVTVRVRRYDLRAQFLSIGVPGEIPGEGQRVDVPVAVRNAGTTTWTPADTRVEYQWLGWDGRPIPTAAGSLPITETVPPNTGTTLRMAVLPPAGCGAFRCTFSVVSHGERALPVSYTSDLVQPIFAVTIRSARFTQVSLQNAYNDQAASGETLLNRADLDGSGNAFPLEEFLPDRTNPPLGYQAGYGLTAPAPGVPSFRFGAVQRGYAPMVRATGQEIELPKLAAATLHLCATRFGRENPQVFSVRYSDGSTQQYRLNLSNWLGEPAHGEPIVLQSRYVRTAHGDDWYLQGSLFAYKLALDPAKKAEALILPKNQEICLLAITLEAPQ